MKKEKSKKPNHLDQQIKVRRVNGYLHKIIPIFDEAGKVINHSLQPFMVELRPRDVLQIIVGSMILGVPVGFTEEVWVLAERLPDANVAIIAVLSFLFLALFVYFNFYRFVLKDHYLEYFKRIVATYLVTMVVIGLLLTLIQKCPWQTDTILALKRVVLVSLPASMSAVVTDTIK